VWLGTDEAHGGTKRGCSHQPRLPQRLDAVEWRGINGVWRPEKASPYWEKQELNHKGLFVPLNGTRRNKENEKPFLCTQRVREKGFVFAQKVVSVCP